jgi:hypothetical protein
MLPVETPLALNPGPEMLTLKIVTLEPLEFYRVAETVLALTVATLPKLSFDGSVASCPFKPVQLV